MKNLAYLLGLILICGVLLTGAPAKAWYDADGNWHSGKWHRLSDDRVVFRDSDRVFLKHYINTNSVYCVTNARLHRQRCVERPANVVFYRPGTILPETVYYTPLPPAVTARLAPAPAGTMYVRSNDSIYLVNRRDRAILDAVDFSNSLH